MVSRWAAGKWPLLVEEELCVAIACLLFFFLKREHNAMVGRVGIINVFSVWQPLIRQEERLNYGMFPLLLSRRCF